MGQIVSDCLRPSCVSEGESLEIGSNGVSIAEAMVRRYRSSALWISRRSIYVRVIIKNKRGQ